MRNIPVILDVDTGVDDALALLFAVKHPEIDIRAVTCVAGNASLAQVVENTLRVLDSAGASPIPVAAGAVRPLLAPARSASHVHGENGLGGIELPATSRVPEEVGAVELMRRTLMGSAERITIVALAPQTNLALLLRTHPEVVDRIERIVFMGGSASVGNATAVAEFNVWHDPEAASIVLGSGVQIFMYGLDVFTQVSVPQDAASALAAGNHPLGRVVGSLLGNRIARSDDEILVYTGLIGDAGAVCALVDPDALVIEKLPVRVELSGYARGQTIVDRRRYSGEDRLHGGIGEWTVMDVALDVDAPRYADLFLKTLGIAG